MFDYFVDADDGVLNVNDDAVSVNDSSDISNVLDSFDEEQYNDENDAAEVDDEYDDDDILVIDSEDEQAVVPSQIQAMTQTIILTLKKAFRIFVTKLLVQAYTWNKNSMKSMTKILY